MRSDRIESNGIGSDRIESGGIRFSMKILPQTIVIQPKSRMGVAKGDHLNLDELPSAI